MWAYALTIFAGAFLLFQVQPLLGKYLLPWFGGAPAVWTTCLLFFQTALLAGYAYAHLSSRRLKARAQVLAHLTLIGLALLTLPIVPSQSWKPPPGAEPVLRILELLSVSIGLPYVALAATAPLLQAWFTRSYPGKSPYRLYALSNAGSLLALLSYPTFFETWLTRHSQATLWGLGLGLYALGCAACGWQVWQRSSAEGPPCDNGTAAAGTTVSQKILWVLLPACASLLLLAITNKICQDLAPVAFLWVMPLTVYLLSFIISFEKPRCYRRAWFGTGLMLALGMIAAVLTGRLVLAVPLQIGVYLGGLFICCMICHGEVYRLRPGPARLTSFYLNIAAGGALGGVSVVVIAPALFADYYELPWGLLGCGVLFFAVCAREQVGGGAPARQAGEMPSSIPGGWSVVRRISGLAAAAGMAWLLLLMVLGVVFYGEIHKYDSVLAYRSRNFYGVLKVYRYRYPDHGRDQVELLHGGMVHGMQFLAPERASEPTLYYGSESGIGLALQSLGGTGRHIGVVGLGAGTLAAYARPGDRWRFYELNPEVERVARRNFSYLKDSAGQIEVVLGDARLSLEQEPPQLFDLMALDAFNSDSIPMHLLTRQAFSLYRRHLKPHGLIAVHISNMSLNLQPVVLGSAQFLGFQAITICQPRTDSARGILPSIWVVLASEKGRLPAAEPVPDAVPGAAWTDDFSSLFPVLRWGELWHTRSVGQTIEAREAAAVVKPDELAATIANLRQMLRQQPDSLMNLNNLACLLATAPDDRLRDGVEAVRLAERACDLTQRTNAVTLATLAAAYAEAGRFERALAAAQEACAVAQRSGQQQLFERERQLLELYRQGRPYHQPPASSPEQE